MTYKKAAPHIARASMVEDYKKDNESIALVSQWYYDFTGDDENHLIGIYRNQNLFTSAKEFAQTHKDNPNVLYTMFNILISINSVMP